MYHWSDRNDDYHFCQFSSRLAVYLPARRRALNNNACLWMIVCSHNCTNVHEESAVTSACVCMCVCKRVRKNNYAIVEERPVDDKNTLAFRVEYADTARLALFFADSTPELSRHRVSATPNRKITTCSRASTWTSRTDRLPTVKAIICLNIGILQSRYYQ